MYSTSTELQSSVWDVDICWLARGLSRAQEPCSECFIQMINYNIPRWFQGERTKVKSFHARAWPARADSRSGCQATSHTIWPCTLVPVIPSVWAPSSLSVLWQFPGLAGSLLLCKAADSIVGQLIPKSKGSSVIYAQAWHPSSSSGFFQLCPLGKHRQASLFTHLKTAVTSSKSSLWKHVEVPSGLSHSRLYPKTHHPAFGE